MTNKEDKSALKISRPVMREQDRTRQAMAKPQTTVYNNFVGSDDIIDDLSDP